jgi:hypothetical protein
VHSARTLRTNLSAYAFACGVRGGDLDALVGEHRVKRAGVLRVAVADYEPQPVGPVAEVQDQVAGLLGGPIAGRVCGDAEDVHPPRGDVYDEHDVQPAQGHGIHVEEVGREQTTGLSAEKGAPVRERFSCRFLLGGVTGWLFGWLSVVGLLVLLGGEVVEQAVEPVVVVLMRVILSRVRAMTLWCPGGR